MAIVIMTHISCDGCGETYGVDNAFHNIGTHLRKEANSEGWTYSSNKDWCPNCRPLKKNGEKYALRIHKQLNKKNEHN